MPQRSCKCPRCLPAFDSPCMPLCVGHLCCACRPGSQPGRSTVCGNRCGLHRVEQQKIRRRSVADVPAPRKKGAVTGIVCLGTRNAERDWRRRTLTKRQQRCAPPREAGQSAGSLPCPVLYQRPGSRAPGLPINQKPGSRPGLGGLRFSPTHARAALAPQLAQQAQTVRLPQCSAAKLAGLTRLLLLAAAAASAAATSLSLLRLTQGCQRLGPLAVGVGGCGRRLWQGRGGVSVAVQAGVARRWVVQAAGVLQAGKRAGTRCPHRLTLYQHAHMHAYCTRGAFLLTCDGSVGAECKEGDDGGAAQVGQAQPVGGGVEGAAREVAAPLQGLRQSRGSGEEGQGRVGAEVGRRGGGLGHRAGPDRKARAGPSAVPYLASSPCKPPVQQSTPSPPQAPAQPTPSQEPTQPTTSQAPTQPTTSQAPPSPPPVRHPHSPRLVKHPHSPPPVRHPHSPRPVRHPHSPPPVRHLHDSTQSGTRAA